MKQETRAEPKRISRARAALSQLPLFSIPSVSQPFRSLEPMEPFKVNPSLFLNPYLTKFTVKTASIGSSSKPQYVAPVTHQRPFPHQAFLLSFLGLSFFIAGLVFHNSPGFPHTLRPPNSSSLFPLSRQFSAQLLKHFPILKTLLYQPKSQPSPFPPFRHFRHFSNPHCQHLSYTAPLSSSLYRLCLLVFQWKQRGVSFSFSSWAWARALHHL